MAPLFSASSINTTANSSGGIRVSLSFYVRAVLMVDLVAKRTATKVSAQWSNDEAVHQILVSLLHGETGETSVAELLRNVTPLCVLFELMTIGSC